MSRFLELIYPPWLRWKLCLLGPRLLLRAPTGSLGVWFRLSPPTSLSSCTPLPSSPLFASVNLFNGRLLGKTPGLLSENVQTEPLQITRYWDLPREVVIDIAKKRRVTEAYRPKVTKTELVNTLLRQDLAARTLGATVWV